MAIFERIATEENKNKICEMCEEYSKDTPCENWMDKTCPVQQLFSRLWEYESSGLSPDEVKGQKRELQKAHLEMSYMTSPNCIGDRHEMGG